MKTIHFKNGMTKEIESGMADIILSNLKDGNPKFITFTDENNNLLLLINVEEIVYIS